MAEIKIGILSGFSGKVGTVIGVNWREKYIIRILPKALKKELNLTDKLQRYFFIMLIIFPTFA